MLLAHAPFSYIANEVIQQKKIEKLKPTEQIIIVICSLIFGILPDFDLFFAVIQNLPSSIHHDFLTHYPITYILIWILLRIISKPISRILNKKISAHITCEMLEILANTFLIGTVSHLIADMIANDIAIFYPISTYKFGILKHMFKTNLFAGYMVSPAFMLELTFISLFLSMSYKKFCQNNTYIKIFLQAIFILTVILIPLSCYISLNTYNNNELYDAQKRTNYDIDYDRLLDTYDMDIGNYQTNNMQKAKKQKVSDSALNIINSHKWTATNKLKYALGGFNSYRIISQTYYDIHLPIEPVLTDYNLKEENKYAYVRDLNFADTLLSYLNKSKMLIELDITSNHPIPCGSIIFLLDKDGNILNMGITLEGNNVATVLDNDKVLQMHKYETVKDTYKDTLKTILIQI